MSEISNQKEMTILPKGFEYCTWEEADHAFVNGGCFRVEPQKHHGVVDSFKIFFEPGESEIGTHQAEHSLGMLPIKQVEYLEHDENQEVKVDYAYIRDRTASDVRQVAGLLLKCAQEIGQGDLLAFENLLDTELDKWMEMLTFRYINLQERKGKLLNSRIRDEE